MPIALLCVAAVVASLAGVVFAVRRARISGSMKTRRGACQNCGTHGPVIAASYRQNTGMLMMRRSRHVEALMCRSCSVSFFGKMTLHTAVLGWWGTISAFVTPLFILNNVGYVLASLTLPAASADAGAQLEVQRQYALNLLATKDVETVVDVLRQLTGAPEADVRAFVALLREAA
jgi:hypothetical protein